jgi:hypothetical protein
MIQMNEQPLFNCPSRIDLSLDSRSISFENTNGERGSGGASFSGRKGSPNKLLDPGEKVVLADIEGPGTIRHFWMTFPPMKPELMRSIWMEVFYNSNKQPSISLPCLDFFGLPHGRPVSYSSAFTSAQEGRGFNSYLPMPFDHHIRIELTNSTSRTISLYYQIDYTLQSVLPEDTGYLHATFRRENPTTMKKDFTIFEGFEGPGRFFGCNVGIRILDKSQVWYGEGEVKFYIDNDRSLPTICGTGLEDYVGTAWGMDRHFTPFAGVPLLVKNSEGQDPNPDFVGFYRWHLPDPIIFREKLKVTIQQIGFTIIAAGEQHKADELQKSGKIAGPGLSLSQNPAIYATGIFERVDDYCATAFVYLKKPQSVSPLNLDTVISEINRLPYEKPDSFEIMLEMFQ